jgi:hypothetical protein
MAAWIAGAIAQVHASQGVPLTLKQLAARAHQIIHATVVSKTCLRNERGEIYTRIEVDVSEVWKGPSTNRFVLVQAGGVLGEEAMEAVGQQEYQVGEEIVDCLMVNSRGEGVSIGAGRGKFSVSEDLQTRQKRVVNLFWHPPPTTARAASQGLGAARAKTVLGLDELRMELVGGAR